MSAINPTEGGISCDIHYTVVMNMSCYHNVFDSLSWWEVSNDES